MLKFVIADESPIVAIYDGSVAEAKTALGSALASAVAFKGGEAVWQRWVSPEARRSARRAFQYRDKEKLSRLWWAAFKRLLNQAKWQPKAAA